MNTAEKSKSRVVYKVYAFMTEDLGLSNATLQVYAFLFSFTRSGAGVFYGSRNYMAETIGISLRTLQYSLKRLTERGLIEHAIVEEEGGGHRAGIRCSYVHERESLGSVGKTGERSISKIFSEEQRNRAYDHVVELNYPNLEGEEKLAARAAVKDRIKRQCEQRELDEAVERIMRSLGNAKRLPKEP